VCDLSDFSRSDVTEGLSIYVTDPCAVAEALLNGVKSYSSFIFNLLIPQLEVRAFLLACVLVFMSFTFSDIF